MGPLRHGLGLFIYDALAGTHSAVPRHRHLSRASCLRDVPALRADALRGGIRYYDAQVDDSRFAVAPARTAAAHGAVCAAGVRAAAVLRNGDRVYGARVQDEEADRELEVRRSAPGFVSVVGGKYTTYRIMARDAVDVAASKLAFSVDASRTAGLPLLGAEGLPVAGQRAAGHPGSIGLKPEQVRRLVDRRGSLALEVLDVIAAELEAESMPDDAGAGAVRVPVRDLRPD